MTITVYKSTDASAPVLSGTVGALVGVLDACLVNGYGAKAAAGWAVAFTATNKRTYRAASGARLYLDVDDSIALYANVKGIEVATAVGTGTGFFPTAAQFVSGMFTIKSQTANSTARPWILIASDIFFYFFCESNQTAFPASDANQGILWFGDINSFKASDAYQSFILANVAATGGNTVWAANLTAPGSTSSGHYIARTYLQTGSALSVSKTATTRQLYANESFFCSSTNWPAYPDTISGGVNLGETYIQETSGVRGKMPGLFEPQHTIGSLNTFITNQDTMNGAGPLSGLTFIFIKTYMQGSATWCVIQINGSW